MEQAGIIFQSAFFHFPKCILQSEFESGLVDQAGITRPGGLRATHRPDLFALKMESYFSVLIIFHGSQLSKNSNS